MDADNLPRERAALAPVGKPKNYLEEGERVWGRRLNRVSTVVVGTLMPYDETIGERIRDDQGRVWSVDASSVRPFPGEESTDGR